MGADDEALLALLIVFVTILLMWPMMWSSRHKMERQPVTEPDKPATASHLAGLSDGRIIGGLSGITLRTNRNPSVLDHNNAARPCTAIRTVLDRISPHIQDDVWAGIFAGLSKKHLMICSLVGTRFFQFSIEDEAWKRACKERWSRKKSAADLERPRLAQLESLSKVQGIRGNWKAKFAFAELDSRRELISKEEVAYFRWQLVYDGVPSRLGLRHFKPGGVYESPYLGQSKWHLEGRAFVLNLDLKLTVERCQKDWSWIIGRHERTEYRSIDVVETQCQGDKVRTLQEADPADLVTAIGVCLGHVDESRWRDETPVW